MLAARMHRLVKKIDRMDNPKKSAKMQSSSEFSAAQALAKMAGKKKAAENVSLQIEVETEMQWRTLLRREGLIVVDVYASWAGPCASMVSILKRVKIEVNDDRLWLAIACSDNLTDLLMFKDQSEPCWLFIGGGKPVKVFRGSNAPKLIALIKSEFANELLCMQGKAKRTLISIDDEVSRRKKAEAEAQKLAKMIKDEDETAEELNNLRKESSVRLMGAMEPYSVLVIQSFLLETGAVTEIRDYLLGEFKIEQERYVNLNEAGVRQLFRIPYEVPDPNEGEDFGYVEPEEASEAEAKPEQAEQAEGEEGEQGNRGSISEAGENEPPPEPQAPKKRKRKMLPVKLPEGLVGDTLIMLLESMEVRKMIAAGKKPDVESLLQTADDYIQLKVGPVDYKDALEHAPYSLHAIYGKGTYVSGVWCPRRYDDKRYVMINFFPRFVTEMLMPPSTTSPKYAVAIFAAEQAQSISKELEIHKKDIIAEGKVEISPALLQEMLKSHNLTAGEKYEAAKKALEAKQVYAVSLDRRNSELMMTVRANDPVHISADQTYGKVETAKLFTKLGIDVSEIPNPDQAVEKFLVRQRKRLESVQEIKPALKKQKPDDISKQPSKVPSKVAVKTPEPETAPTEKPTQSPSKTAEAPVAGGPEQAAESPPPAGLEDESSKAENEYADNEAPAAAEGGESGETEEADAEAPVETGGAP